jgi:NAD(P)-dependent dehydrogenase (short-subunit alcohol dehydrogenase family)
MSKLVELACDRHSKLDVLVNNAGIGPISPLDELGESAELSIARRRWQPSWE